MCFVRATTFLIFIVGRLRDRSQARDSHQDTPVNTSNWSQAQRSLGSQAGLDLDSSPLRARSATPPAHDVFGPLSKVPKANHHFTVPPVYLSSASEMLHRHRYTASNLLQQMMGLFKRECGPCFARGLPYEHARSQCKEAVANDKDPNWRKWHNKGLDIGLTGYCFNCLVPQV
jgi:hypothetical protein